MAESCRVLIIFQDKPLRLALLARLRVGELVEAVGRYQTTLRGGE